MLSKWTQMIFLQIMGLILFDTLRDNPKIDAFLYGVKTIKKTSPPKIYLQMV